MNYFQAIKFLDSLYDREKLTGRVSEPDFHLRSIARLLHRLGRPQGKFRSIHIVGTKGKGSISAFVTSALLEAGFSVGTYTSPHLCSLRERIVVDSRPVERQRFADAVEMVSFHMGDRPKEFATYFEVITACAFILFAQAKVNWAVIEAGLGGMFDATNVIVPKLVIIGKIGLDHTEILGHTLGEIARQKAGVIKPGCIVVSSPQDCEVKEVIIQRARRLGIVPVFADESAEYDVIHSSPDETRVRFKIWGSEWYEVTLSLAGDFQAENFITAALALTKLGVPIGTVIRGCRRAKIRGRMEKVSERPLVIVDGAHNVPSARVTAEQFAKWRINPVCVIAINKPKDFAGMISEWSRIAKAFVFTRSSSPRCYSPDELAEYSRKLKVPVFVEEKPKLAIELGKGIAGESGAVFATGSLYFVADLICFENEG